MLPKAEHPVSASTPSLSTSSSPISAPPRRRTPPSPPPPPLPILSKVPTFFQLSLVSRLVLLCFNSAGVYCVAIGCEILVLLVLSFRCWLFIFYENCFFVWNAWRCTYGIGFFWGWIDEDLGYLGVWRLGLLPVWGFGRCLGLAVLSGKCTVVVLGCVDCEKRFIFWFLEKVHFFFRKYFLSGTLAGKWAGDLKLWGFRKLLAAAVVSVG